MKIEIPNIVRPLPLGEYAPEYGDAVMQVWVNPPSETVSKLQAFLARGDELRKKMLSVSPPSLNDDERDELKSLSEQLVEALAEIWSQGDSLTRMSVDEINALALACGEKDPGLYPWLLGHTWLMILSYRAGIKKN